MKENFASDERGDCDELSEEIGKTLGADKDFWSKRIGLDVENITRAGTKGQVLKDSELSHDIEVKVSDGELRITRREIK